MANEGAFLGRGWAFPPGFSAGGAEVEMVAGAEDIHESLQILLATQPGERVMQEKYGCELSELLFEEIDEGLINSISQLVSDAILYHEPRIELERLRVSESPTEPGKLQISMDYTIRGSNSRFNMVYPFYVKEAPTPAG